MDIYDILTEEGGFSEEQIDQLFELGVLSGEMEHIIPREQMMADKLRRTRMPEARAYGNVYQAANPLEFLGAGMQQFAGQRQEKEAQKRQMEILKAQAGLRGQYLGGMSGAQVPPPGGRATPMPMPQPGTTRPLPPQQGTPYDQWQPYIGPQPMRR